jgi:tetratricopeptide (TPR) repeat protein
MADRYTYIPLIGLFIMLAWGLPDLLARWPHRRVALPAATALAIAACAIVASRQVGYWKNTEILWTHTVSVTDDNFFAHSYLAKALAESGKLDEALVHHRAALRIRPDSAVTHHNLGFTLARLGRVDEAIEHFETALRLNPRLEQARQALDVLAHLPGRPPPRPTR